jgi:hypothetical protein
LLEILAELLWQADLEIIGQRIALPVQRCAGMVKASGPNPI